jgi:predicted dehydrogenase
MAKLRCAVIGVGYLGRFHAQKYAQIPQAELIGVYDLQFEQAEKVAHELDVAAFKNLDEMLGYVDAVSIAASTPAHYELAKKCLCLGKHVLLEKPMTATLAQARELIEIADEQKLILQVGHLERFNPAYQAYQAFHQKPRMIEAHRLATFKKRGIEVDVVLDLMVHDLDIILSWITSPITQIHAKGISLLTDAIDVATVMLNFENGCVAQLNASRVHSSVERQTRVYHDKDYFCLNYQTQELTRFMPDLSASNGVFLLPEELATEPADALYAQIRSFIASIQEGQVVAVDGHAAYRSLELALMIQKLIYEPEAEFKFV